MPDVVMPRLSDTMEEGELARWLKKEGDEIHKGDVLAEIETDKATMDLEAFDEGVLQKLLVEEGTLVAIGQPVAVIGEAGGAATDTGATDAAATDAAAKDSAASNPAEKPRETEEPTPAPAAPPASDASAPEPSPTEAAEPVAAPTPAAAEAEPAKPRNPEVATDAETPAKFRTSPLARRTAREHDLDLASVTGTGPGGRIVRADVEDAVAAAVAAAPAGKQVGQVGQAEPAEPAERATQVEQGARAAQARPAAQGDSEKVPLSNIRKVTARRLTESQAVPHFFLTSVVNAERLLALRGEINERLQPSGVKISVNDLLVRACAVALRMHPEVNASWADDGILRHRRINIGIAVSLEDGLIVPVIVDADRKSLSEIGTEARELAERARAGKLKPQEFSGGTFTVSNLGMFGIDQFTAVINPPEAAILAVGAAREDPVLRDGQLVNVPRLTITLTVDHRVLDGASGAAFVRDLTAILEEPLRIVV